MKNLSEFPFNSVYLWTGKPALEILIREILILFFLECVILYIPSIVLNLSLYIGNISFFYSYFNYTLFGYAGSSVLLIIFFRQWFLFKSDTYTLTNNKIISFSKETLQEKVSHSKQLLWDEIEQIEVKKGFWDIKNINSGSIIFKSTNNKGRQMIFKHIKDIDILLQLIQELVPNILVKFDDAQFDRQFKKDSLNGDAILWQGTKSLNYVAEILFLKFFCYFFIFLLSSYIINVTNDNMLTNAIRLSIFACCYGIVGVLAVLYVKASNRIGYKITNKDVIRVVKNRSEEKLPITEIKKFRIKPTSLNLSQFNIGTLWFYDRIHMYPKMAFHSIENLNEVKGILIKLNLPSIDQINSKV